MITLDCEELSSTKMIRFKRLAVVSRSDFICNKHKEEDQESPVHGGEVNSGVRNVFNMRYVYQHHRML